MFNRRAAWSRWFAAYSLGAMVCALACAIWVWHGEGILRAVATVRARSGREWHRIAGVPVPGERRGAALPSSSSWW